MIWSDEATNAFSSVDVSGALLRSVPWGGPGDWRAHVYREPFIDWEFPFQQGAEDLTRRLQPLSDSTFATAVMPNERVAALAGDTSLLSRDFLVVQRRDRSLSVIDTLRVLPARHLRALARRSDGEAPRFAWPLFAAAPLWSTGRGWLATADAVRPELVLTRFDGTARRISWRASRRAVTPAERHAAADWTIYYTTLIDPAFGARHRTASRRLRDDIRARQAQVLPIADSIAEVTALLGHDHCLWVSGHAAADGPTGISNTWLVIDVDRPNIEAIVRVPRFAARLRRVDAHAAYATVKDSTGEAFVERYRIPRFACATRP